MWYLHTVYTNSTVTRYTELRTLAMKQRNSRTYIYCDILHVVQLMLCVPTLHATRANPTSTNPPSNLTGGGIMGSRVDTSWNNTTCPTS